MIDRLRESWKSPAGRGFIMLAVMMAGERQSDRADAPQAANPLLLRRQVSDTLPISQVQPRPSTVCRYRSISSGDGDRCPANSYERPRAGYLYEP